MNKEEIIEFIKKEIEGFKVRADNDWEDRTKALICGNLKKGIEYDRWFHNDNSVVDELEYLIKKIGE